jgi:hypothetical protein
MSQPTSIPDELNAMRRIAATLDRLDPATRSRVVGWIGDRWVYDRHRQPADRIELDEAGR